ncbi:hypothetical protein [Millisia brevis]|uniref:hypothetical protein n=1 Tax=Millisia brevis TaxID=264148 RepID=UPI0012ED9D54|nr:hypothetical protein [Millisia brevis]
MNRGMNTRNPLRLLAGAALTAAAGAALILSPGVAGAAPYYGDSDATCTYVGGREKVKVTVTGESGLYRVVSIAPGGAREILGTVDVAADGTGTAVLAVPEAGNWGFEAFEDSLGSAGGAEGCRGSADIAAADPTLDTIDSLLSAVGSSALSTDPAER